MLYLIIIKQTQLIAWLLILHLPHIKLFLQTNIMNTFISSTMQWVKKQYFNGVHCIQLLANQLQQLNDGDIYLFGIRFPKQNMKQALILYQSVLWFTYRDNLHFQGYPSVRSDVGWGCMLRVGQMLLAQTLRTHQGSSLYANQKRLNQLLFDFINQKGQFCIQNFAKIGKSIIGKQPGQWYSPYDIAIVIKQSLQSKVSQQFSTRQRYLTTVITSGEFSLKTVYQQSKILIKQNPNIYKTKPCLLIIICRIGFEKPQQEMIKSILQLIKQQKNFIGILGGRPGKAHYIFGTTDHSFIYLDPHCVKYQLNIESFLCQTLFSISHQKIDSSMGICFYLKNFKQIIFTHQRLRKIKCSNLIYCHEFQQFQKFGLEIQDDQDDFFQILQ